MSLLVNLAALAFLAMGAIALARPERVVALFGTPSLTPEGRNEVRAVYGGFGVAAAGVLLWAQARPEASGALAALGFALWGMAAGRAVSALVDRRLGSVPLVFLAVEALLGAGLLAAWIRAA